MKYFGFAIADGMFPVEATVTRRPVAACDVAAVLAAGYTSCCNPQHRSTLAAAKARFGLDITVPEKAPLVSLKPGDSVMVMSVRGLPRLEENRHEYTTTEIEKASFVFGLWTVVSAE